MKQIELTQGKVALVDDEDFDWITSLKWHFVNGYASRTTIHDKFGRQHSIRMHRQIMGAKKGQYVDHINHDTLDNRKQNLRICTNQQNTFNKTASKNSTSIYKGVSKTSTGKWQALVAVDAKNHSGGSFSTELEAALIVDRMLIYYHKEFAFLNFPNRLQEYLENPYNPNKTKVYRGKSIYKGVGWSNRDKKWTAQVALSPKKIWLGYFPTEIEAAKAYDNFIIKELNGTRKINFPKGLTCD